MDMHVFERLHNEGHIDVAQLDAVMQTSKNRPVSLYWDLRILLSLGVTLVGAGVGILLYKNIDTIGHAVLIALTGIVSALCFVYCLRRKGPYSNGEVASPSGWFDYVLLLGCTLLLLFVGYLQFMYQVFGTRWGLASFIPMMALFSAAYYFDNRAVLTLAITNLAAWIGLATDPLGLMRTAWGEHDMVVRGIELGLLLHICCTATLQWRLKLYFEPVYRNFGTHVLFISLLAAMFVFDSWYLAWFVAVGLLAAYYHRRALAAGNFYYLVCALLYAYAGLSHVVIKLIAESEISDWDFMLVFYVVALYFIATAVGMVKLLMRYNKMLRKDADV